MSEFAGSISEFPGVSIDRFNGDNLKSTVYFLLIVKQITWWAIMSLSSSKG